MTLSAPSTPPATWQACGAPWVAVYGTLRAGGINDIARLAPGITCAGHTTLIGTLYDLGWYPGLRLQGTQTVLAEVYPLHEALEQALDGIEGLWPQDAGEYRKQRRTQTVRLHTDDTAEMDLLIYEALPATVQARPVIAAEDWIAWQAAQGRQHPSTAFTLNAYQP